MNVYTKLVCGDDIAIGKTISCSNGLINILNASYGRENSEKCCFGPIVNTVGASNACSNTNCYSNKTEYFKSNCDFKNNCTIYAASFSDPCYGIYKYIEVSYACICNKTLFVLLDHNLHLYSHIYYRSRILLKKTVNDILWSKFGSATDRT
jgi:hypothetical protein